MRGTTASARRAHTLDLLLGLARPTEVEFSPDGRRIAFAVAPAAKERDASLETRLWVGPADERVAPIGEAGRQALPRFSPRSGAALAFASDEGHPGRMSLRLQGRGEVGSIQGSVEDIHWAPDGESLLVLVADLGADRASTQTATPIREEGTESEDPKVIRPASYWRRLYLVRVESGETRRIALETVNVFECDWAGGKVVAICTDDPSEGAWYGAWLGLIDIDSGTVERVHTPEWQLQCPRISPQGRVAWIEGVASDRGTLAGTAHVLGAGALASELDVTWLAFADETTLWYAARRGSGSACGRLRLDGRAQELLAGDLLLGERFQPRVSPSANGTRIAAVLETPEQPPEVVVLENGTVQPVTRLNAARADSLPTAAWRSYVWASFDGLKIEGLLALPPDRVAANLPLVVYVHGGPTSAWSWGVFSTVAYSHPLLLVDQGFAVLMPNPRGSAGRGQAFARANVGDMGGADLNDILFGVDALVRDGIADTERVAITGGSYGGFMSAWAVTQTDRFAAAVARAVLTDWVGFHLTTNIAQWDRLFMNADPFDPGGEYARRSPVYHARNCTTPTLILHGEEDRCTPVPQAVEFYNALVEAGCVTELVVYPREGHVFLERGHQADAWTRTRDWLAEHLG